MTPAPAPVRQPIPNEATLKYLYALGYEHLLDALGWRTTNKWYWDRIGLDGSHKGKRAICIAIPHRYEFVQKHVIEDMLNSIGIEIEFHRVTSGEIEATIFV